jgi:ATP-dependent DNA helicase PIF1
MEFSEKQQIAFDKYKKGENIFITGPGGSGKSELIRRIYIDAKQKFKDIYVTALTGCAAILLNCNAKTVHSWSGIGLGNGTIEQITTKVVRNRFACALWKKTDILVIDEVSMLSKKMFDLLNAIGKIVRGNFRPFGGIQIVFSGDFYQLPPVGNRDELDTIKFCFESDDWGQVFPKSSQIQLIKIFRQKDEIYSNILNQIRVGRIKKKSNELLLKYVGREKDPSLVIEPTKLFPTKNKVELINNSKMVELESELHIYKLNFVTDAKKSNGERQTRSKFSEAEIKSELDYLTSNLNCDKEVKIKVGCQVMCIVNIKSDTDDSLELCNGSQGIVKSICPTTGFPLVKFNNGLEKVMGRNVWLSEKIPGLGVSQVPLILAWALTIHKSQGTTLDCAEIDAGSSIFECGQTYVALSRVKSLDGLYLSSFVLERIQINTKVQEYYDSLDKNSLDKKEDKCKEIPTAVALPINTSEDNPFLSYRYIDSTFIELVQGN